MSDVLVLCYHAISPTWDVELAVAPDELERQLHYLAAAGWTIVPFTAAVLNPPSRRTLALTFDDAFASVSTYAAPVIRQLGLRATVFVPTSYIDGGLLSWPGIDYWQHTRDAGELAAMSWDHLGALAEDGWEIGSHTRTHPHLTELDDRTLAMELEESRTECRQRLGRPCESIAYPYGDVDERVASCAARSGYKAGAALSSRLEQLGAYRWPRTGVYRAEKWWKFRLKLTRPMRVVRGTPLWVRR